MLLFVDWVMMPLHNVLHERHAAALDGVGDDEGGLAHDPAKRASLTPTLVVGRQGNTKKSERQVSGRSENMRWVNFDGDRSLIGEFVDVVITEALPNSLRGRLIDHKAA